MQELGRDTFQPRAAVVGDQGWGFLSTGADCAWLWMLHPRLGALPVLPMLPSKHKPLLQGSSKAHRCAGVRQHSSLFVLKAFRRVQNISGLDSPFTGLIQAGNYSP